VLVHPNHDDETASPFLRAIIDSVADPIFVKDEQHRWIEFNRAFCELMGRPREQLLGKSDYEFFPKQEADVFWKMDDEVFRSEQDNVNEESITDAKGVTRIISTKKSVLVDPTVGKVLVGVIRDFTELRQAERRNLEMSQQLATSAKFAALGEMAGGIAHEINTPLAIIQALSDELLDLAETGELGLEAVTRANERISGTITRMSQIISGLRAFARDEAKDAPSVVPLRSLVSETLGLCGENLRVRGIELRTEGEADDVTVSCRSTQIVQILLNLLNNARDAVAGTASPTIVLRTSADDACAEVRVTDSGRGIPLELRERIMEPFFTTKPVGRGTGIGLSIARSLAEDNGGSLSLTDGQLPEGRPATCFVLRLPRAASAPEASS
jgi:PAS domain S-box-containing protein